MKKTIKLLSERFLSIRNLALTVALLIATGVFGQGKQSITGKLVEGNSKQAVPFATIALIKTPESKIIGGTMSDDKGVFIINPVHPGNYTLQISNIGYKPEFRSVEVKNEEVTDAGIILLQDTAIMLNESVIIGERIKAKSESDRTTFFVTQKMLDVSNSGTDVLKLVPGVQVDLMQNISLEGSRNIMIYVDGKERDKNYLSQLNPDQIDQIEVISVPPSNFDGNVTGAINIILKKNREVGISGHILAEIPVSFSEIYVFPACSFNYGFKKWNFYTSYNGAFTYLDLYESTSRKMWENNDTSEIALNQYLRQKDWSHRFHYGFDYFLNDHNQFNFYAFYNPYSRELDGNISSQLSGKINDSANDIKEDTDHNTSTLYSLYYRHEFEKKGSEMNADISYYSLNAENRTDYIFNGPGNSSIYQTNIVKPKQNSVTIKADYKTLLWGKLNFSTGAKARLQVSKDKYNGFEYNESIIAGYNNLLYKHERLDISAGLRLEESVTEMKDNFRDPVLAVLPNTSFRYKLTSKQYIQLSYNRTLKRPNIYQLNPFTSLSDPYMVNKGNPFLKPEFSGNLYLEHSIQFNGNYISSRLFLNHTTDAINDLMFINDTITFETQVQNLGTINQFGLQFSGTMKLGILTLNPFIKAFRLNTSGNELAKSFFIADKNSYGFESGLSAIASFKHDLAFSLNFQYNSEKFDIQGKSFSDLLYFVSLEKSFRQKIKVGISSALPFTRTFTYNGSEICGPDFQSHYEGKVNMSTMPVWVKIGYQFNSGRKREKIDREKEEIVNLQKKGF
ncbi:MAG TPA: TonB-dependent receptor [Bacteroidales bacterium]|nr:TonB-dependent receptor [Bacteroidales bacterium]